MSVGFNFNAYLHVLAAALFRAAGPRQWFEAHFAPLSIAPARYCACTRPIAMPMRVSLW
jgi:hypothetical protein